MLDIKFVRENPEKVKENIKKKFQDKKLGLVDEVIALDVESRATQQEADSLRSNRKTISKQIGALMGQGKKEEAEELKKKGMKFVGSTIIYSYLQAIGVIYSHDKECFMYKGTNPK